MNPLKINSIFQSISGEAGEIPQGTWCTFIRLQGCNLKCDWCDTPNAQKETEEAMSMSMDKIIRSCEFKHIIITGGEPLLQPNIYSLFDALIDLNYIVQVETNGSFNVDVEKYSKINFIFDWKCPSSGMSLFMNETVFQKAKYIKFVVQDKLDLNFAIYKMKSLKRRDVKFIISPLNADGNKILSIQKTIQKEAAELLDNIIFSVQIHKIFNLL